MLDGHLGRRACARPYRELNRLTGLECGGNVGGDRTLAALFDRAKDLREDACGLLGSVLIDEQTPRSCERLVERGDQLVDDLPQRLRLVRELAQVVAVVDRPAAERLTRMHDDAS